MKEAMKIHGNAKLNEEKVAEIRRLIAMGVPCTRIAKDIGMSYATVFRIKSGQAWPLVKE